MEKEPEITQEAIDALRKHNDPTLNKVADKLQAQLKPKNDYLERIITCNAEILKLKEHIKILAHEDVDDPVLIIGESGTGKELIANALHNGREGKFVPINCAGMPDNLIESELFGYEKGTFTGGLSNGKKGLFEEAVDGTIFLDEIAELSIPMQAKLLRAIQENKIRRVGGKEEICISCRFISATHRNIDEDKEGSYFRRDLFWRISTIILRPLKLALRMEDVPLIIAALDKDKKFPTAHIIPVEKLDGNVRSLQQIVRRFYLLGELP